MRTKIRIACIFILCMVSWGMDAQNTSDPISQTDLDKVGGRRALVGPNCMINRLSSSVNLLANYDRLDAVTDEGLNNFATILGVSVGVGVNPAFGVKDVKNTYAAGTQAGFNIVSTDGGGLLTLELIKMFSIAVYNDGKLLHTYTVDQGQGTGLGLDLIKLPTSDNISVDLTVTPQFDFDEIYLMVDGVDVSAIQELGVKYAFVGKAKEYPLTYNGVSELGQDWKIDLNKWDTFPWSTLFPGKYQETILNDNLDDKLGTGGIAIGEWLHLQIGVNKVFEAGTEVGFKYSSAGLLNLSLGGFTTISLYKDGKKVQEETLEAKILGLEVATSGITKTSIISQVPFDAARLTIGAGVLSVDLGEAAAVYYGFVKQKPEVEHHCPINPSASTNICSGQSSIQLQANRGLTVMWSLVSQPEGSAGVTVDQATGLVSGLTAQGVKDGDYVFRATAADNCYEEITIHRGITGSESNCGTPLVNGEGNELYAISDKIHDTSGSLLSISDMEHSGYILDETLTNYGTYVGGLSVANDLGIIGLKTKDGSPFGTDIQGDKRVGFIVENASTFLDAKVLEFFQIRLYRNGVRLKDNVPLVIDESNTVGVGLIGEEKSQKIRFSIRVPAGVAFDEFQLWKSGVLDLGLSTLRVYYGFIESNDANCSDPVSNTCATIVSPETTKARLELEVPFQTASIAAALNDADYLVDNDMNTPLHYINTVEVGSGIVLKVKLGRTLDKQQQLGIAIDNNTYVAGVGVGSWMTVSTYHGGVATGEEFSNWGVVGLDVIGYGDKKYLISNPQKPYDEVRITLAGIANLLNGYNIYGLFFRGDQDGDGLPDCMDPDSCEGGLSALEITSDVCAGEQVFLTGMVTFRGDEVPEGTRTYEVSYSPKDSPATVTSLGQLVLKQIGNAKRMVFREAYRIDIPGEYVLWMESVPDKMEKYPLTFTIHPNRTKWTSSTSANNVDWNRWDNWDRGAPWTCTDVVIPAGVDRYPDLKEGSLNGCRYIHFEPDAEVVNTHRLTYQKAWVEIDLKPNRYYMVAVPLKETRSGDWFMLRSDAAKPDTFAVWNEGTAPANRIYPTVYQRLWESTTYNRLLSGGRETVYPGETRWTTPANLLAAYYDNADGYALSVWVHHAKPSDNTEGDINKSYTFRFPKEHAVYHYMDPEGNVLDVKEQMRRDPAYIGRFIHEGEDGSTHFPVKQRVRNIGYENKTYLIANPFMAHIDVEEFLKENTHLTSVKVYDGTGSNSLIFATDDAEGLLVAKPGSVAGYPAIAPTQSFFVTTNDQTENELCEVSFTEAMLKSVPGKGNGLKSTSRVLTGVDQASIRLKASVGSAESWALLRFSAAAYDAFREAEDAEILIDCGAMPPITLFTLAGEKALDIQQRNRGGQIPLGFYVAEPGGGDVTLSLFLPENCDGWTLEDLDTPRSYPLDGGRENVVRLGKLTTNVGRFYLKGASPTANEGITASPAKVYAYREAGSDRLVVRSSSETMCRCELFNESGKLGGLARFESDEYHLSAVRGVNIIKIYFKDGRSETLKIAYF